MLASQGEATINGQCHPLCAFVVAQDGCDITFGYPEGDPGGPEWHLVGQFSIVASKFLLVPPAELEASGNGWAVTEAVVNDV